MTAWPSPRVAVFVSSTIGECAEERAAARSAIESIKCEPILFEAIGARPHPARVTYMEGLGRAQICVIIWKESYGWIDPAINISGIEDEFRIARERHLDLLVYIKADAANRDARVKDLVDEARTFVTTHSYKDAAELQDQISSDITSLLSQAFLDRTTRRAERLLDPAAILVGSMPLGMIAVERPALERSLEQSVQIHTRTWLVGAAGAGKTILLSQWAARRSASYVNARGLSLRQLLSAATAALSKASVMPEALSLDEAANGLRKVWDAHARWPLVVDDPSSVADLLGIFDDLGDAGGAVRVILGAREAGEPATANTVRVPGLTSAEAAEVISRLPNAIGANLAMVPARSGGVLPLDIRKQAAARSAPQYLVFDDVEGVTPDPKTRELLAFIVASPEPLTLEELGGLTSSEETAVQLDDHLAALSFLLVDDGLGFRPVHDEIANDLRNSLARRPALRKFVSLRLAQFFAKARRYLPAFALYQDFDPKRALRMAYRAAAQASMEGRFAVALRPMEFIVSERRKSGQRLELVTSLIALSQAYEIVGNKAASTATNEEAEKLASELDDADLKQAVADQKLVRRVRHELRPEDLAALAEIRQRYKAEGRVFESARLANEEGAILISVGQEAKAIPVLREAREDFLKLEDRYGVYVATRNLIASLNMQKGGQNDAEELLRTLEEGLSDGARVRERAWMCNILARRYRLDGRLDDAVAVAREAIEIGRKIGDPYLVALNRIGLGNALREKGELDAALEEFQLSGKEAQAISRTEIDGLASRLASSVLLEKVEHVAPYLHPELYNQAETFATYVIGLLSGSIAEMQAAQAYDCRGDARWGLGRKGDARFDWAMAARIFLQLDPDDALSQLNTLARNLDLEEQPIEAMRVMLSTLPEVIQPAVDDPWPLLISMLGEGIEKGHPRGAGVYATLALKLMQHRLDSEYEVGLWLRILTLALENRNPPDDGRMAFVLSAFLAHTHQRNLSVIQLTALTDLTLGRAEAIHFHSVDGELQTTFNIGPDNNVLMVVNDLDNTPATRFAVAALVSFFAGFRKEIDRDFLSVPLENGLYIRCSIVDVSKAPDDIQKMFEADQSAAVSISMQRRAVGQPHDILVACRSNIQERCQGDMLRGTELQLLYGQVLRALLAVALGGDIESEVLRPKIVRLIRQTI